MAVDATVALAAGTVLALGAAVVVLGPLWLGADDAPSAAPERDAFAPDEGAARAEGVSAVEALREIEFDRATGKLSDDDYDALKAAYTRDALAELRAKPQGATAGPPPSQRTAAPDVSAPVVSAPVGDPVEAALRAYRARQAASGSDVRVCPVDGPRPEGDSVFCSACGRYLAGSCPSCGAACDEPGQRFCTTCGTNLAAVLPATADV